MSGPPRGHVAPLIEAAALDERIAAMAHQIAADYGDAVPTLVCVLKGAMPFFGRLATAYPSPCRWSAIGASSYQGGTETTGRVHIHTPPDAALLVGCDIVLVEDIVDTGLTLTALRDEVLRQGARSVRIATLLDKPSRRRVELVPEYVGFEIPDAFVVGFGLDLDEHFRGLPYVGVFEPER